MFLKLLIGCAIILSQIIIGQCCLYKEKCDEKCLPPVDTCTLSFAQLPAYSPPLAYAPQPLAYAPPPVAYAPPSVACAPPPVAYALPTAVCAPAPVTYAPQPAAYASAPVAYASSPAACAPQPAAYAPSLPLPYAPPCSTPLPVPECFLPAPKATAFYLPVPELQPKATVLTAPCLPAAPSCLPAAPSCLPTAPSCLPTAPSCGYDTSCDIEIALPPPPPLPCPVLPDLIREIPFLSCSKKCKSISPPLSACRPCLCKNYGCGPFKTNACPEPLELSVITDDFLCGSGCGC